MINHPSESDLALYAGNDLGRWARLRVDLHLRSCGKCQQEVTEFSSLRAETLRNASEPDVKWDRLAAEMKANIRLGLEAGECIAPRTANQHRFTPWAWAALATATVVVLAAAGEIWINHNFWPANPALAGARVPLPEEVVLEAKGSSIQMRDGDAVMSELRNNSSNNVDVVNSVDVRGRVSASYVDRDTGMVTVNNIYYGQ